VPLPTEARVTQKMASWVFRAARKRVSMSSGAGCDVIGRDFAFTKKSKNVSPVISTPSRYDTPSMMTFIGRTPISFAVIYSDLASQEESRKNFMFI
jgi:hypothetical protein